MKKKREMEMKKQFLKSAAILSLAVTAVSTSQPVGAIAGKQYPEFIIPKNKGKKLDQAFLERADNILFSKFEFAKSISSSDEFQEQEYTQAIEKLNNVIGSCEAYMVKMKQLSMQKKSNEKYIQQDRTQKFGNKKYSHMYSGVDMLEYETFEKIKAALTDAVEEFKKDIELVQKKNPELVPYNHYYTVNGWQYYLTHFPKFKEYDDLISKLVIKQRQVVTIYLSFFESTITKEKMLQSCFLKNKN